MSEEKKINDQQESGSPEQLSLNDDRRVKVLSPGTLVAKRFFRNRLAVVGLTILAVMFIFSFIGGLISPYGQDEVSTATISSSRNTAAPRWISALRRAMTTLPPL